MVMTETRGACTLDDSTAGTAETPLGPVAEDVELQVHAEVLGSANERLTGGDFGKDLGAESGSAQDLEKLIEALFPRMKGVILDEHVVHPLESIGAVEQHFHLGSLDVELQHVGGAGERVA